MHSGRWWRLQLGLYSCQLIASASTPSTSTPSASTPSTLVPLVPVPLVPAAIGWLLNAISYRGDVCPARMGPLGGGPNPPPEDRDLPDLAGFRVKIAICGTELRQIRRVSGLTTQN